MFTKGNLPRLTLFVGLMAISSASNAQIASMWWNKFGDASNLQPGTVEVPVGTSTVKLSVYLSTASFTNNVDNVNVMFGFDKTSTSGTSAAPDGSGLSVAHGGTNTAPTGVAVTWNTSAFSGGAILNKFGGGNDASTNSRAFGLWTSNLTFSDFGFSNTSAVKMFDIDVTIDPSLGVGSIRPVTLYSAPTHNGTFDSSASASGANAFVSNYVANIKVVPEPASMAALGLGLVGLVRRRRGAKS